MVPQPRTLQGPSALVGLGLGGLCATPSNCTCNSPFVPAGYLFLEEWQKQRHNTDHQPNMNRQAQEGMFSGSTTITSTPSELHLRGSEEPEDGILNLSAQETVDSSSSRKKTKKKRHHKIKWREDVIDNENMGKKKSKICCIYHRPKAFDESSSSSSSSDDDSSGSSCASSDNEKKKKKKKQQHSKDCHSKIKPNKYETAPRYSPPPTNSPTHNITTT